MSGSLDTNIVLRLMRHDIPEQTKQAATLLDSARAPFEVADTVFIKVAHVLERYYTVDRLTIKTLISEFMRLESVHCNRELLDASLIPYVAHPALSFEDCYLAAHAEHNKALPLYTFDQKLAHQLDEAVLVC